MSDTILATPAELRAVLLHGIVAVIEGRINVSQANAIVGLSSEVHKSIRQEWDMSVYMSENIEYKRAELIKKSVVLLEGKESND